MKSWFGKRLPSWVLCCIMVCAVLSLFSTAAYADSGSYTATNGVSDHTISISYDGFSISSAEENGLGLVLNGTANRGDRLTVSFAWNSDNKNFRSAFVNGRNSFDIPDARDIVASAEFWTRSDDLEWAEVVSRDENGITLSVTVPADPEIIMITVGAEGPCGTMVKGIMACVVHITIGSTAPTSPPGQTATHNADADAGEDIGTEIWNAIVEGWNDSDTAAKVAVSIGGALAGAGAIGAASGGKKNGDEEEKKRKTYKMKVYKGFGDGIRRGAKPVTVWARIVEVVDGEEINRPDLSERITVSGAGMDVRPLGVQNTYKGAEVSVPADSQAQTATLTFTFTGAGGVFRNNITFKVLGEPEITFPAVSADGTRWNVNDQNNQVDMIAGVRVRERLRFVITNAAQEPKAIRFRDHDGFDITYEKDPQWQFTYYACIENKTAPIEKESGIFAAMVSTGARVEAEFEDGITIWSYISIRLFPEGLAAQGKLENGRLTVNTLPLENPTEGFAKILPTVFSLTLAYPDASGHAVVAEEPWWTPKELTDDGKYGLLFKENFKYKTKYQTASEIAFYPEVTLPSLGDPYEVKLHLAVDAGRTGGRDYSADLPMAIFGEEPKRIYADDERKAEMERIKKDIKFFGLAGDPGLSKLLHEAARGECSAAELRNIRYRMLEAAWVFYQEQGDAEKQMADLFSKYIVVAGAMVKGSDLHERPVARIRKDHGKIHQPLQEHAGQLSGRAI